MNLLARKLHSLRIRRNRARQIGWHRHGGQYTAIFDNKHYLSGLLRGWGMKTPLDRAILDQHGATWLKGSPFESTQWPSWLGELDHGSYFIKPVSGNHGRHAGRLDVTADHFSFNGKTVPAGGELRALLAGPGPFLLQDWIDQHPDMTLHSNRTVNTVRALTLRLGSGKVTLFHAVARHGRSESFLDNFHAGGIAVGIDTETGRTTGNGIQLAPRESLKYHPDSGKPLAGQTVPCFEAMRQMAVCAHSMFPGLRSVGWDMAVSRDGPVIVEGNLDWDAEIHAFCDPGFRARLFRHLGGQNPRPAGIAGS